MMNPLDVQVGGSHYKNMAIQPVEYCHKNRLGGIESSVIRYICRWREKNGLEDLAKIPHYVDLLMALESESADVEDAFTNSIQRGVWPANSMPIPWKTFTKVNRLAGAETWVVELISTWRDTPEFGKLLRLKRVVLHLIETNKPKE